MKNILKLFFFIVFVLNFKTVLGQKKQQRILYGVYLGGNISKFNPLDLSKNISFGNTYKWNGSYNFGANIDFVISNLLYFESGLNFISKKSNSLSKELFTKTFYNYANGNTSISNMAYMGEFGDKSLAFQIPLSLHLNIFQKGGFKSNIYGGILWENMFEHNRLPAKVF